MDQTTPGISVLICTYNGSRNLPETIRHLAVQQLPPDFPWEIVLVNNASTDNTREVAAQLVAELMAGVAWRIVDETRPGKDRAMDTGLALAKYQFVLICDDDNWLDPHYVQRAFQVMQSNDEIGMLGGRGIPVFESMPPEWFGQFENYYAVGAQNPASGEVVTSKGFLWGAGAVLNKIAYHRLLEAGFKRFITYDRCPEIARGEDVELCLAIRLTGYKIWYDEQLVFRHYLSAQKLTWAYITKLAGEGGIMSAITGVYQLVPCRERQANGKFFWLRATLKKVTALSFYKGLWYNQFRWVEGDRNYVRNRSMLYGGVGYLKYNFRIDGLMRDTYRVKERLKNETR